MLHVSELLLAAPTAAIHGNTLCPGPRAGDLDPRCSHPARLVVGGYDDSVLLKTLEGGVEVAMEAGGDHGGLGRGDILDLANLCRLILRRVVLESRLAVDSRGTLCSTQSSHLLRNQCQLTVDVGAGAGGQLSPSALSSPPAADTSSSSAPLTSS